MPESVSCRIQLISRRRGCEKSPRQHGARAASGHVTAAPPSSVMKSRRFIRSPRRRGISIRVISEVSRGRGHTLYTILSTSRFLARRADLLPNYLSQRLIDPVLPARSGFLKVIKNWESGVVLVLGTRRPPEPGAVRAHVRALRGLMEMLRIADRQVIFAAIRMRPRAPHGVCRSGVLCDEPSRARLRRRCGAAEVQRVAQDASRWPGENA